ncbi:DUF3618 domain-containing protein [Pseudotabrizicola formosa]|uniref:DUF3618 domain-containing protein n=1 Tax=Pseudotabrizicola formosa TaxID=2030009 RepID=UPI000CD23DF4|nr:DUF3618 domain-containing protein [Pseudotabrizicola formosa]
MTVDTRSSDDIERDIREERERMSESINNLQQKFSVDAIVNDIGSMFRMQGDDIGRVVTQTVGRNPAAVALVGVGLAWLFLGQNRSSSRHDDDWDRSPAYRPSRGSDDRWRREVGPTIRSGNEDMDDADQHWYGVHHMDRGRIHRHRAGHSGQAEEYGGTHGTAESIRSAVSGMAEDVSTTAADLTERLSHGLEDLSEEARARVIAARRAAHDARIASTEAMQKGMRSANGFFEDQPLVVGALAVALGAAIGGVLPHSKLEDDTLGDSSDRLFAEAQDLFYSEREKAMAMARTVAADVKGEIKEAGSDLANLLPEGKSAGDVIVDRAAVAATRIYDHATGEAKSGDKSAT